VLLAAMLLAATLALLVGPLLTALLLLVRPLAATLLTRAGIIRLTGTLSGVVRIAHAHLSSRVGMLPPAQKVNAQR
jgi:hypothetical protein